MLQEIVANELGLNMGEYVHMVSSMHLYVENKGSAERYIDEGFQRAAEMPKMSGSAPLARFGDLLAFEQKARRGIDVDPETELGDPYWADLGRLIQINFATSDEAIEALSARMNNSFFYSAIEDQRERVARNNGRSSSETSKE